MPPKKKKPQPGSRRRRGNTASPPEPGGGGSLRERLGIGVQPRQLQHASEVAARLSPRAARAELAEMEAMLSRHGYPSRYAANLRSDGMGPLELEHRLRTPPGNEGSLVYTHDIPHPSRVRRQLPGESLRVDPIEPDNAGGAGSAWNQRRFGRTPVQHREQFNELIDAFRRSRGETEKANARLIMAALKAFPVMHDQIPYTVLDRAIELTGAGKPSCPMCAMLEPGEHCELCAAEDK